MTLFIPKFNIFSSNICAPPEGVWRGLDEKLIGASVLMSACEQPVITNNSFRGACQSLPKRYHPHTICGLHTGVWITSWDEWLLTHSFRELPIETVLALKPCKESKTTLEGNEHQCFVNRGCYSWKRVLLPFSKGIWVSAGSWGSYLLQMGSFLTLSSGAMQGFWELINFYGALTVCQVLWESIHMYYSI